ncbi:MAG TPA: class E sortase [Candidatus Aquicultor sp.]|jgi:sortase A
MVAGDRTTIIFRITGLMCIGLSLFICLQVAYTDIRTNSEQQQLQVRWNQEAARAQSGDAQNPQDISTSKYATGNLNQATGNYEEPRAMHGEAIARLVIPKIGLDEIVLEGIQLDVLKNGPGHMEGTAYPGEPGNMVISGHRVTNSHPFFYLDKLEQGDPIYISTQLGTYTYYVIDKKVIEPSDIRITLPTRNTVLTLTTCNPRFSAATRLVIVARIW